jgi:hypothetical protein
MIEAVEARLEKMDGRHVNLTQRDRFDFHGSGFRVSKFQGATR